MKTRKSLIFLVSSFFFQFLSEAVAGPSPDIIHIGVIAPLTGSNADRGTEITRVVNLYAKIANDRQGKYKYEFTIDDGKCGLGSSATTIAQKFIFVDHYRFLIAGCSGETMQAGMIANRAGVLTIGVLASDPAVRDLGDYVFRTYADIDRGVEIMTREMHSHALGRIAVLNEELAFTLKIKALLEKYLGQAIVSSQDFPSESSDFRTLAAKIKQFKPDAVYLNCSSPKTCVPLVNQVRTLGISQPLYTYYMPEEKTFLDATGANSEGIKFIGTPVVSETSDDFKHFMEAYRAAYPDGPVVEFLLRTTHDAAKALIDAIEQVGPEASAARDFLYRYKSDGALGMISFDDKGDIVGVDFVLKKIAGGKPELITKPAH
jgi:branched-chain amino acid transport system substrate-binding protein